MQLSFTEEQRLLEDSALRFLAKEYGFEERRRTVALPDACAPNVWSQFAEMGWLGLPIAEEAGGFGGGPIETGLLMRALGRYLVVEPFLPSIVLAGALLSANADKAVALEALETMIAGGDRVAAALRDHGKSPVAATADGQGWVLSGAKLLAAGAAGASLLLVTATLPDGDAGLFLLSAALPGVDLKSTPLMDGSAAADLRLDGVRVDSEALLRRAGDTAALTQDAEAAARLAACWEASGAMRAALEQTVDYVGQRQQFGRAIGSFQTVQHKLAEMSVAVEEADAACLLAALSTGGPQAERTLWAAKAKLGASARLVSREAVQLHGGMGVSEELPIASYFRKLLSFELSHGSTSQAVAAYARTVLPAELHARSAVLPLTNPGVPA